MEHLALDPPVMRKRVEEILDLLGLADLRDRPLRTLSGGQQQRVAIGAALTAHPRVLVLDEPTSALDPTAAEEVIAAVTRLVHDLGHDRRAGRASARARHPARRSRHPRRRRRHGHGRVARPTVLAAVADVPPIVGLARLAGLGSDAALDPRRPPARPGPARAPGRRSADGPCGGRRGHSAAGATPALVARGISVAYGSVVAVRVGRPDAPAPASVTAVMGRNGSGKSSLLWALQGSGPRRAGTGRRRRAATRPASNRPTRDGSSGLVPQEAQDLLYLETVDDECRQADLESGGDRGHVSRPPRPARAGHPGRGPSARPVRGPAAGARPGDPAHGDARGRPARRTDARPRLRRQAPPGGDRCATLAADGRSILLSTHDVEFVATVADRVLVMADGEIVADGSADATSWSPRRPSRRRSPGSSRPLPYLTVDDVVAALAGPRAGCRRRPT